MADGSKFPLVLDFLQTSNDAPGATTDEIDKWKAEIPRRPERLPFDWEDSFGPSDPDSPESVVAWIDKSILGLRGLEAMRTSKTIQWSPANAAVRDAFRLVRQSRDNGWTDEPLEPKGPFSAHDAVIELEGMRKWVDDRKKNTQPKEKRNRTRDATKDELPAADESHPPDAENSLPAKQRKLAPSRIKAKSLYDWAMSAIPGADDMTINELFDAIESNPSDANKALPPTPESFGKYLRDAGVKKYLSQKDKSKGKSIQNAEDL